MRQSCQRQEDLTESQQGRLLSYIRKETRNQTKNKNMSKRKCLLTHTKNNNIRSKGKESKQKN